MRLGGLTALTVLFSRPEEEMGALIALGVIGFIVYQAFREGKREGSRKGFGVGRDRGSRSRRRRR